MERVKEVVKKYDRIEDAVFDFIYRFRLPIFMVIVTLVAAVVRVWFIPFASGDFSEHLDIWLNEIRAAQGLHSIGQQIGNYTTPYHYLMAAMTYIPGVDNLLAVKIPSIIADFVLAGAGAYFIYMLTNTKWKAVIGYCALLCLPTVLLNAAAWGQCDAMYTSFLLLMLCFWIKDRKTLAMVCYGLAQSIKLQAVFVLPALIILMLCRKLKLRQLLAAIPAYVAVFLPAIIAEGSLTVLFRAYTMQTAPNTLVSNIYSFAYLFRTTPEDMVRPVIKIMLLCAILALGALAMYCWNHKNHFTQQTELLLILFSVCFVPFILPSMRERYFYVAEVFTLLYAFMCPKKFYLPLLFQLGTLPVYLYYLFNAENPFGGWLMVILAIPSIVVFWDLRKSFRSKPAVTNTRAV